MREYFSLFIPFICLISFLYYRKRSEKKGPTKTPSLTSSPETNKTGKEKKSSQPWLPDTYLAIVIAVAILSANVAVWKTMPSLWNILLNNDWWRLLILNICFWIFWCLQTIKVKDNKGIERVNPVAGKVAGWDRHHTDAVGCFPDVERVGVLVEQLPTGTEKDRGGKSKRWRRRQITSFFFQFFNLRRCPAR